eukprot:359807-Chlamydomonas_euryale.AAC.2
MPLQSGGRGRGTISCMAGAEPVVTGRLAQQQQLDGRGGGDAAAERREGEGDDQLRGWSCSQVGRQQAWHQR